MISYTITDLQALVSYFRLEEKRYLNYILPNRTHKMNAFHRGKAAAYREMADMLERTTIEKA